MVQGTMKDSNRPEAEILVAKKDAIAQLRLVGRMTFKVSRQMREFCLPAIQGGLKQLIVDFSKCQAMDSTFMGTLSQLGLEARNRCAMIFVNTTRAHRDLLDGLGITHLFRFVGEPVPEVNWVTLCSAADQVVDMKDVADTVLSAHQTLMEVNSANIPKFKSVVEMMAAEVEQMKKEK